MRFRVLVLAALVTAVWLCGASVASAERDGAFHVSVGAGLTWAGLYQTEEESSFSYTVDYMHMPSSRKLGIGVAAVHWNFDLPGASDQGGTSVMGLVSSPFSGKNGFFSLGVGSGIYGTRVALPIGKKMFADVAWYGVSDAPSDGVSTFFTLGVGYTF
ncbi:MAG: hypothetical protein Q7T82_03800 [Armatimonadota bacterium]|nr:hypothetical protein [Armatimonadota bacterium]